MQQTIEKQVEALRLVGQAIVEAVRATPEGMPGGLIYATLMEHGCTLEGYELLMGGLVKAKLLEKRGQLYHAVPL